MCLIFHTLMSFIIQVEVYIKVLDCQPLYCHLKESLVFSVCFTFFNSLFMFFLFVILDNIYYLFHSFIINVLSGAVALWTTISERCNSDAPLHIIQIVTATMKVHQDFFLYLSGVYHRSGNGPSGYHSVRIVGWGEDVTQREPIKFWVSIRSYAIRHSIHKVN
jgi:hypothetical protein